MKHILPILSFVTFCGCAAISPDADPVVVNAERGTTIAFETVDSFLALEHTYREWFRVNAPDVHAAAEKLRKEAPAAFASVNALRKAYKASRTPEARANLETALAVINQLGVEASVWLARAQTKKNTTYHDRSNHNCPRHIRRQFVARPDFQGPSSRQTVWRMDGPAGIRVPVEAGAEDGPGALAA